MWHIQVSLISQYKTFTAVTSTKRTMIFSHRIHQVRITARSDRIYSLQHAFVKPNTHPGSIWNNNDDDGDDDGGVNDGDDDDDGDVNYEMMTMTMTTTMMTMVMMMTTIMSMVMSMMVTTTMMIMIMEKLMKCSWR